MEIRRSLLDDLTNEINTLSSAGQQMISNALSEAKWSSISELREIMIDTMNAVCGEVTDLAAARSAIFYDEIRHLATGNRFGALAESGRVPEATEGAVRALIQSVAKTGTTERFDRELADRVDYEIKRAAGNCVTINGSRDPLKPRYGRVPAGTETCTFCIMLASRGFVYKSASLVAHVHTNCDCRIVPGFSGMTVEGYDPDALYERYSNCRKTVADKNGFASEKDVFAEMRRRDSEWLSTGKIPEVTFENESLHKEVMAQRPWELRTAERLSEYGYRSEFIIDYEKYFDKDLGLWQQVGLADTAQGLELKTIMDASKESTIDDYLRKASKKKGVKLLVFDTYEAKNLTDVEIIGFIKTNMGKRGFNKVLVILQNGLLRLVQ